MSTGLLGALTRPTPPARPVRPQVKERQFASAERGPRGRASRGGQRNCHEHRAGHDPAHSARHGERYVAM